jgi:hypothetical protein
VLSLLAASAAFAAAPSRVEVDANARAEGNRKAAAVALGRVLLLRTWPAQVLKVRIDGVGSHAVAGLVLSGVKFHARLDEDAFLAEVAALVERTFASSAVEEVDLWATVPIAVGRGTVVAGDFAAPTTRTVFTVTLRRRDAERDLVAQLRRGKGIYWAPDWRRGLDRRAKTAPRGPGS